MGHAPVELSFDRGTLLLRGLAFCAGWELDRRIGCLRTHALHYRDARARLRVEAGRGFRDSVRVPARVAWPKVEQVELRAEQAQALSAWERTGARGLVVMPTGTDKTEVALAAMARTRVATLVVAPVRDLMHQWHRRILRALGYDAGIVGDSMVNLQPVTVTTYDSAYARMAEMGDRFGLIVFDEAHHLPGRSYREAALLCTAPMRLGLTATPERSDGRHSDLQTLIGPTVYCQEIADARGRSLADYDVVRIPVKLGDEEQRKYDKASHAVRSFMLQRLDERRQRAGAGVKRAAYTWQDLCSESGKDPTARKAQKGVLPQAFD